jgi:hypothetical protein
MALTQKQRRRRDLIFVLGIVVLICFATVGRGVLQSLFRPDIPGYEKRAPSGNYVPIEWDTLKQGTWALHAAPVVPAAISQVNGHLIVLKGFMLPFHMPGEANEFWIAGRPSGCYYCNPPGVAEVVHVKVAGGKNIMPTDYPVRVFGTLKVAQGKEDDALYTVEEALLSLH